MGEKSVFISEVSSFQRLKYNVYTWGEKRCPVHSFQGSGIERFHLHIKCTHISHLQLLDYSHKKERSCLHKDSVFVETNLFAPNLRTLSVGLWFAGGGCG